MSTELPSERPKPGSLQRLFFKSVPPLYRGPLAWLFRWRCIMLLTATGRKTGKPRTTAVSFMPRNGNIIIFSGWGKRSNWYQNVRANPNVTVQVGRERMRATAHFIEDPERRRQLMLQMRDRSTKCGPPQGMRQVLAIIELFDYQDEIRRAVEHSDHLPVVELVPVEI
jgi:deazaflavin-dependent oxidoreductase (nitroreductase family)